MSDTEDFMNIDQASDNLIKTYQIQVDDDGNAKPVFIGSYKEIPFVTHTTILYDQNKDLLNTDAKKVDTNAAKKARKEARKKGQKVAKTSKNVYRIHIVTYLLPEDAIQNKIYKIVGLIIQKNDDSESLCSLDLRFNVDNGKYEYIFVDHHTEEVTVVDTLEKFPGKEDVIPDIAERMFMDPIRSIILS